MKRASSFFDHHRWRINIVAIHVDAFKEFLWMIFFRKGPPHSSFCHCKIRNLHRQQLPFKTPIGPHYRDPVNYRRLQRQSFFGKAVGITMPKRRRSTSNSRCLARAKLKSPSIWISPQQLFIIPSHCSNCTLIHYDWYYSDHDCRKDVYEPEEQSVGVFLVGCAVSVLVPELLRKDFDIPFALLESHSRPHGWKNSGHDGLLFQIKTVVMYDEWDAEELQRARRLTLDGPRRGTWSRCCDWALIYIPKCSDLSTVRPFATSMVLFFDKFRSGI